MDDYEPSVYDWRRGNQKISRNGENFLVWHGGVKHLTTEPIESMADALAVADELRSMAEWNS